MKIHPEYEHCGLCPRNCGVNRLAGEKGVCGQNTELRIASICAHYGEEPSFSGQNGSGTVFLTGCACKCVFCQNYQISRMGVGDIFDESAILQRLESLIASGVHNINFVTPDHFWPHIREICTQLKSEFGRIPIIFNISGYQTEEMIAEYSSFADIFLPDFKFTDPDFAKKCMGDRDYPHLALNGLRRMVAEKGFLFPWDPSGVNTAREGVLIRHLVMPGHVENTLKALDVLVAEFGSKLPLSAMSQYHPIMPGCERIEHLDRVLKPDEYNAVIKKVYELGLEHVYLQNLESHREYIPDFQRATPFRE